MPKASNLKAQPDLSPRVVEREKLNIDGLTTKQFRFATLVFSGLSNAEAYRSAYDCSEMLDTSVYTKAAEIASVPAVQSKVRELRLKVESQSTLASHLSREFVLNGLMRLATHAEKESVQLGALQTLGKTVGIDLFRETVVHETRSRTVEDVETELKAKLDTLRAGLTIDGSSRAVAADTSPAAAKDRRRKPAAKG